MDKYNFQIIPPRSGKVRQIRIGRKTVHWALVALAVLFVINLTILVLNFTLLSGETSLTKMERENRQLRQRLDLMAAHADSLESRITGINSRSTQLMEYADLPVVDAAKLSYGIGGPELDLPDPNESFALAKSRRVTRKLDSLLVAVEAENEALTEAREEFEEKKKILAHTPSIRPMQGYISSGFGRRLDPFTGIWKMHEGIDICARRGTPVRSAADGRISFAGWYHGYGKMVRVDHIYYETRYGHLDEIKVRPGERVKRGDIIGTCGNSGHTTGVHLHYEVRVSGRPVNPRKYLYPDVVMD